MLKIKRFEAKNIKRLKFVEIVPNPDGGLTIISGKNAQGKSSTLDSLAYLLGGAGLIPDQPIRAGEKSAYVEADMGDVIIRRDFTLKGSKLTITKADGKPITSVQSWLNARIGEIGFDPLEFTRLKPKAQREKMMGMVKLEVDIDKLDADSKTAYESRRDVNREVKRLEGVMSEIPPAEPGLPKEEVSIADLSTELQDALKLQEDGAELVRLAQATQEQILANDEKFHRLLEQKTELEEKIKECKSAGIELVNKSNEADALVDTAAKAIPDIDAIKAKLSGAEEINAKVRQEAKRKGLRKELRANESTSDGYTATIDENAETKEKALAKAEFPTPGLGFDETGVTYKGLPFEQASQAEQLHVSLSIAMLDNPEIKVILIKDGSLLDCENLAVMDKLTKDAGYDCFIERVEEDADSIVIEDGMVKKPK